MQLLDRLSSSGTIWMVGNTGHGEPSIFTSWVFSITFPWALISEASRGKFLEYSHSPLFELCGKPARVIQAGTLPPGSLRSLA